MKNTDIKFVAGQVLLIAGMGIMSIGARWSFFTRLALMTGSAGLGLRSLWPTSFTGWTSRILLWIAGLFFLAWLSAFGTQRPPVAALIGVWLGWSMDEFNTWRQRRRLT